MSLFSELVEVYDLNKDHVGEKQVRVYNQKTGAKKEYFMLPIAHMMMNINYQIDLNQDDTFAGASVVKEKTLVPVTIDSANRTGRSAFQKPLPVDDKIFFLARDCSRWVGDEKYKESNMAYMSQLEKYLDFLKGNSNKVVFAALNAVHSYLQNNDLIADLIRAGIYSEDNVKAKNEEELKEKIATMRKKFVNETVRFNIRNSDNSKRFEDSRFFNAWAQYYLNIVNNSSQEKGIDYITGKQDVVLTDKHPKGVLGIDNNAKLISANDKTNYTYRGRFLNAEEAVTIGYEESQKIHSALKWLLDKQSFVVGKRYFLTWGISNNKQIFDFSTIQENPLAAAALNSLETDKNHSELDTKANLAESFKKNLLLGDPDIGNSLKKEIHILELQSSGKGRFGIVYYQSMGLEAYIDKIAQWYEKMAINKTSKFPSLYSVAKFVYGRVDDTGKQPSDSEKKLLEDGVSKLVYTILGSQMLPWEMLSAAYNRSTRPQSYSAPEKWMRMVNLTAGLFKTYYIGKGEGELNNMLNKEYSDRSYLFGRLLAVADLVEGGVLNENGSGTKRVTNARRYLSAFSQRPMSTWKIIYNNLQPYLRKSRSSKRAGILIDEIFGMMDVSDPKLNAPLDGKFLIGYSQQRNAWFEKKSKQEGESNE